VYVFTLSLLHTLIRRLARILSEAKSSRPTFPDNQNSLVLHCVSREASCKMFIFQRIPTNPKYSHTRTPAHYGASKPKVEVCNEISQRHSYGRRGTAAGAERYVSLLAESERVWQREPVVSYYCMHAVLRSIVQKSPSANSCLPQVPFTPSSWLLRQVQGQTPVKADG
jgi:hypothetical protein